MEHVFMHLGFDVERMDNARSLDISIKMRQGEYSAKTMGEFYFMLNIFLGNFFMIINVQSIFRCYGVLIEISFSIILWFLETIFFEWIFLQLPKSMGILDYHMEDLLRRFHSLHSICQNASLSSVSIAEGEEWPMVAVWKHMLLSETQVKVNGRIYFCFCPLDLYVFCLPSDLPRRSSAAVIEQAHLLCIFLDCIFLQFMKRITSYIS